MSELIFETFTDERGNISVRISQEVQVLTREEANRIEAEYRRMQAENESLRELARELWEGYNDPRCEECHLKDTPTCADCPICAREASVIDRMRELGVDG